jgi:hypothetical protein
VEDLLLVQVQQFKADPFFLLVEDSIIVMKWGWWVGPLGIL